MQRAEHQVAGGLSVRQIMAVAAGNALEAYDFTIFGFFAIQIGKVFFPMQNAAASLLLSLATFGAGFLMRPLGGLVLGRLGDVWGRKSAMILSFALAGGSIVGAALTPSYASIGVAAPLLMVLFRVSQGFGLGGEVGPATALLLEAAPPARRGLYVSLIQGTLRFSILFSGLVGLALASLLSPQALTQWGWRVAFLIGAAVVPFGLMIRRSLPETLPDRGRALVSLPTGAELWVALLGILILMGSAVATYVINYMTTYASNTLGLGSGAAFGATVAGGLSGTAAFLLGGWASDKTGRKPVMLVGTGLLTLAVVPCFIFMAETRTPLALIAATGLISALFGFGFAPCLAALSENLPAQARSGGIGIVFALALSVFGGSTQFIVTWLIGKTGSPLVPAWYMAGFLLLSLCGMALIRESAPVKVRG